MLIQEIRFKLNFNIAIIIVKVESLFVYIFVILNQYCAYYLVCQQSQIFIISYPESKFFFYFQPWFFVFSFMDLRQF